MPSGAYKPKKKRPGQGRKKPARSSRPPTGRATARETSTRGAGKASRAGAASGEAAKKKVRLPPPPALWFQILIYAALLGGCAMLLYGVARVVYALAITDMYWVAAAMIISGMLGGVAATVLVGLLAWYAFNPIGHRLRSWNKTYMAFGVVGAGMLAIVVAVAVPQLLMLIIPGLVPAATVLFMVVRPRIRAIATARGRPAPLTFVERRTKALEDARREREAARKRAEQWEKLKRRRAGQS